MSFWFTLTIFRMDFYGNFRRCNEKATDTIIFYQKITTVVMSENTDIDCILIQNL